MDNWYVIGIWFGVFVVCGLVMYYLLRQNKRRRRELQELGRYFPDRSNESIPLRHRRNKDTKIETTQEDYMDPREDRDMPKHYKKSIFHAEHLQAEHLQEDYKSN